MLSFFYFIDIKLENYVHVSFNEERNILFRIIQLLSHVVTRTKRASFRTEATHFRAP